MTGEIEKLGHEDGNGSDLTETIRKLSRRAMESMDGGQYSHSAGVALQICSSRSSRKWGPRWLENFGFEVELARDADEAYAIIAARKPDIVILEAGVPGRGGDSLAEELAADDELTAPLFTLCNSAQEVEASIHNSVDEIASKPFDWQLLAHRAKQAVRQRRLQAEHENMKASLSQAVALAKRAHQQLRRQLAFEPVTGLPNRQKFIDLLGKGLKAAASNKNHVAVFAVRIRRFPLIIEALGRKDADGIIAEIGRRLNRCVQKALDANAEFSGLKTAAIANTGTGRFAAMLTCSENRVEAQVLQQQIEAQFSEPAIVAGQAVYLSTAVGAAVAPEDASEAEVLLIRSESAMREAYVHGSPFQYFSLGSDATAARRLKIEHMLHGALDKRELRLAYQPISDVASDRVVAAEALLRWPQADGGFIGPGEFVPIAEDAGLMNRIGQFVLEEACRQIREWQDAGLSGVTVAVNLARSQLMDPALPDVVASALADNRIDPALLDLEISERGVLNCSQSAVAHLIKLKSLGVTLSVDDFGTGDSSIAYLNDMPVDTLKIDRSYISQLVEEGGESRMIAAMVALAQELKLTVIAEGVETLLQLDILRTLNCNQYQGFLRAPAIAPDAFLELARKINA